MVSLPAEEERKKYESQARCSNANALEDQGDAFVGGLDGEDLAPFHVFGSRDIIPSHVLRMVVASSYTEEM